LHEHNTKTFYLQRSCVTSSNFHLQYTTRERKVERHILGAPIKELRRPL